MGNFYAGMGSGHCGSMWIAKIFNSQSDITGHHELRQQLGPGPWHNAIQYDVNHTANERWFQRVAGELEHGDVYDGISWGIHELFDVAKHQSINKIFYLVRHPILQLQSLWTGSNAWRTLPEEHFIYTDWLYNFWQCDPAEPHYFDRNRWGKLCELIRANVYGPRWLQAQGFTVLVKSLEELTVSTNALRKVAPGLSVEQAKAWQQQDINRKVKGNRCPTYIWNQWTQEMRETFETICAEAINLYGYTWPEQREVA